MSNLKNVCRIMVRIKYPKTFRNRSRGLPMRGDSLPKSGNFWYFWGRIPTLALHRFGWNFSQPSGPMAHVKFHVNRCNESPLRAKNLIFGLWINLIPAVCAWRNAAGNYASHTRTVVRECCKGDDASQWENVKFDPLPPPNPLSDRHKKLHTWLRPGYLPTCKI